MIRGLSSMKKKQFKYVMEGNILVSCLSLTCLTILKCCDNSIRFFFFFSKFLFFIHWICKCTLLVFGRRCKQRDRWNYSTRKVGKFAEKSLRSTALEKSKFLAKSINLETTEGCHSNCERKLVERVARRSKLISDSSQLIHWQELNSSSK